MKKNISSTFRTFSQEHIIIFSCAVTLITLLISSMFKWDSNPITGMDKLTADISITIFCMIIIFGLGLTGSAGFRRTGFLKGLLYGVPFIVIGLGAAVIGNAGIDMNRLEPLPISAMLMFTINMLFVGVNEEVSMRALILNNLVSKYGERKKGIYRSILISSLIFGMIHLVNIFFMPPVTVIVQAVNAAGAGVLFATIYILSRNIWSCILVHAVVDWLSLFIGQCFVGGASVLSVEMTVGQGLVMIMLGSLPPIVIAVILLNKKIAK